MNMRKIILFLFITFSLFGCYVESSTFEPNPYPNHYYRPYYGPYYYSPFYYNPYYRHIYRPNPTPPRHYHYGPRKKNINPKNQPRR